MIRVRGWHELYAEHGITGLVVFNHKGSQGHLSSAAGASVFDFVRAASPRNTRMTGAWIAKTHGVDDSHAGPIALLHRLKLEYRKPGLVSAKPDAARPKAFIEAYDRLLNRLGNDAAVVFAGAVHPAHQARLAGCRVPEGENIAVAPNSGRQRLNIHGAINPETGATQMLEVPAAGAQSTILPLKAILAAYPALLMIHVHLDNARYHHARMVREWLAGEGARITLHFIPPPDRVRGRLYSPHLNPIERLWAAMHRNVTHNRCHATFREFKAKAMTFLTREVPRNWSNPRDKVTDNFRVINPSEFRGLK